MKMSDRSDILVDSIIAILKGINQELDSKYIKTDNEEDDKVRVKMLLHSKMMEKVGNKNV